MLIGQPVVFGILELEVGVAELALLGTEIFKVFGAVVNVAQLVLVVYSRAVLATVGGPEGGTWMKITGADQDSPLFFKAKQSKTNSAQKVMLKCQEAYTTDWGYCYDCSRRLRQ